MKQQRKRQSYIVYINWEWGIQAYSAKEGKQEFKKSLIGMAKRKEIPVRVFRGDW